MSSYSEQVEKELTGRRIEKADIDGYEVRIELDNGTVFTYEATDGGFSMFGIHNIKEQEHE